MEICTLLLCRVNPHYIRDANPPETYADAYKKIHYGSNEPGQTYVAFGSFDAVRIYWPERDSSGLWLEDIGRDRDRLGNMDSRMISYHPIHLISDSNSKLDQQIQNKFPYCVITLCYGVEAKKCTPAQTIKNAFQSSLDEPPISEKIEMHVYHAINICDAVVLWYTSDINRALEFAAKISRGGHARKTYTFVAMKYKPTDDGPNKVFNFDDDPNKVFNEDDTDSYKIRIFGSIRNHFMAQQLFLGEDAKINEILNDGGEAGKRGGDKEAEKDGKAEKPVYKQYILGQDDFSILYPSISEEHLDRLINKFYQKWNKDIAQACWDVHTEFLLEPNYKVKDDEHTLPHPISQLMDEYKKNVYPHIQSYPWATAFSELLSINENIDRHPVLRAPSILLTDFLKVSCSVFADGNNKSCIENSIESIQKLIRHWDALTSQIIKDDDLIFHGTGNNAVLFNAVPFTILAFYHVFLSNFRKELVKLDLEYGIEPEDSEYAFLLIPEQNQRTRISEVFHWNREYALKSNYCANNANLNTLRNIEKHLQPKKQIYIIEFPSESIYRPQDFILPLLHECFHHFGNALRRRDIRAEAFTEIIVLQIMMYLELDTPDYSVFQKILFEELRIEKQGELYLRVFQQEMLKNIAKLFESRLEDLITKHQAFDLCYLKASRTQSIWTGLSFEQEFSLMGSMSANCFPRNAWTSILNYWGYYFSECYADLLVLLTMKIPPKTYLKLFDTERGLTSAGDPEVQKREAERIGLVLAANAYFNSCVQSSGRNLDEEVIFAKFAIDGSNISSRMKPFTKALVNFAYVNARNDTLFFDAEWSNCVAALDVKVDSPGQLKCVFNYLCSVCVQRSLIDKITRNRLDDFKNYFVHENMFTPDFYEKISNCEVQ